MAGEVVGHVGIYGIKAAECFSVFDVGLFFKSAAHRITDKLELIVSLVHVSVLPLLRI